MALTKWNPSTQLSRGNVSVGVAPAIATMTAPTIEELNAGIGLDCAITTFNGTSDTDSETIDWLCDPASEQLPTSTTHSIDDLVIKGTGQEDDDLITALQVGDAVYFWRRDGIAHDTAAAVGQKIWIWKAIVTSIDPLEGSNTYIGITAHITVMSRTPTTVAVVAGA